MRNWEEYVRSRLALPGLAPERESRIVRELAGQLEDFYREALARGLNESDADAFARRQIRDWNSLTLDLQQASRPQAKTSLDRLQEHAAHSAMHTGRRRWTLLSNLLQDARYSLRQLRKAPGFTAIAIVTFALGIGANSVMFGMVYRVLLAPLPYPDPEQLVFVWQVPTSKPDDNVIVSAPNFLDWQKQNRSFTHMAAAESLSFNLSDDAAAPAEVFGVRVSSTVFPLLGVPPLLGRTFTAEEDRFGNHHVVVLSQRLWERRYGADPGIVGRQIKINGEGHTVVGVMPDRFRFYGADHLLWVPIGFTDFDLTGRGMLSFVAVGRMKPGIALAQAQAEMKTLAEGLQRYPENREWSAAVQPMDEFRVSEHRIILYSLFGAVGFVLLIACANISNLLLARAATRRREIAIRSALGANRGRIVSQLLTESLMLGLAGGAAGALLALWGNRLLPLLFAFDLRFAPFRDLEFNNLDVHVLGFTFALALFASLLFGALPSLGASRDGIGETLKEGGRGGSVGRHRARNILVVTEIALALVILAGAGLMVRSLSGLLAVSPGFDPEHVLVMRASLPQKDSYGVAARVNFCRDVGDRVGSLPGVLSVSTISHLPVTAGGTSRGLTFEGRPLAEGRRYHGGARYRLICPDYFKTMKIPLLRGREFTDADTATAPGAAIISEAVARLYFKEEDPIGKRFKQGPFDSDEPWVTIVGVVDNIRDFGLDKNFQPVLYRPYTQSAWPVQYLVVRTAGDPLRLAEPVRSAMAQIDPEQPLADIRTMQDVIAESVGYPRLVLSLLGAFATLAVVLAGVGIYGVTSHSVTERTREIGIRMALGAHRNAVLRLVLRRGLLLASLGLAAGAGGALLLGRLLQSLLYKVPTNDPIALGGAAAGLGLVALLACFLPALRATRVDPLSTLREE